MKGLVVNELAGVYLPGVASLATETKFPEGGGDAAGCGDLRRRSAATVSLSTAEKFLLQQCPMERLGRPRR